MDAPPPPKRPRLSMACNQCRRRKVKCDAEYPKCRNCRVRCDDCSTEDPKRPGEPVIREWIEGPPHLPHGDDMGRDICSSPGIRSAGMQSGPSPSAAGVSTNANSTNDAFGISPVHQSHDMTFNLDHETNRIKMMGASSSQTLMKSLDVYLKAAQRKPLANHFIHAMRHSEEVTLPAIQDWPSLPSISACEEYMAIFFTRIHYLYPMLDIDHFKNHVRHLIVMPTLQKLPPEQIPVLASAYLVMSLGMDEKEQKPTPEGDRYLQAASGMLSHVMLMPYLASVQCLLLFTIAYRSRNKDGVGWQTLGVAIRVAHTLGLHRFSSVQPSSQHGIQVKYQQLFHARIWGICCCLEKTMQLESGRPSSITDVDRDQMMGPEQRPPLPMHDFLQWHVGLAEYQGQISHHIYGYKPGTRSTGQLLLETAKLDTALLAWANEVPTEFRPGSDIFCSNQDFHAAAHMSIQYHQAMIALHRAALVAPIATFESEVTAHCPEHASLARLRKGESICVNSARMIARLTVELMERRAYSRVLTVSPAILACIVLSIYLLKTPSSRLQASDLELLHACAESTAEQCLNCNMDPRFAHAPIAMHQEVKACLARSKSARYGSGGMPKAANVDSGTPRNLPRSGADMTLPPPPPYDLAPSNPGSAESRTYGNDMSQPIHVPQSFPDPSSRYEPLLENDDGEERFFEDNAPFTGLNVEDLWNWMLITDGSVGGNDLQWTQQSVGPS